MKKTPSLLIQKPDNKSGTNNELNPTLNELQNFEKIKKTIKKDDGKKIVNSLKIKRLNSKNELVNYNLCSPIDELQRFGGGMYFYFYFLKFLMKMMVIVNILILIPLVINSLGGGLKMIAQTDVFLATSLGNINKVLYTEEEIAQMKDMSEVELDTFIKSKSSTINTIFAVYMGVDMIICIVIFVSYYVLKRRIAQLDAKISKKVISVRNYSLLVKGVPETGYTKDQLKQYFNQFGEVISCSFAYKYNDSLYNMMNIAHYKFKLKKLKSEPQTKKIRLKIKDIIKKMKKEIKTVSKKINVRKLDINDYSSFKIQNAFVTFNDHKLTTKLKQEFESAYRRTFWQWFCCVKKPIDEKYFFKGQRLRFEMPDHPKNIYWENLEYSNFSRRVKVFLIFIIAILILLASIIINLFISAFSENENSIDCENKDITKQMLESATAADKTIMTFCYCTNLSITDILNNNFDNGTCYDIYVQQLIELGISLAIGGAISLINAIIEVLIFKIVTLVRYSSKAEVIKKRILFITIVEYINTAFVVYIIYSRILGWSLVEFINNLFGKELIKIEGFVTDVNRNWYPQIGSKIIMPILIAIFVPHVTDYFKTVLMSCFKSIKARNAKNTNKYVKQMEPEEFILEIKYNNVLKNIFVVFTFSTGLPLLNLFLFGSLLLSYWIHKYIVLRYSKKPPLYSSDIIKMVTNMIPYALIVHMLFGIYFLSNEDIFPTTLNISLNTDSFTKNIVNNAFLQEIIDKAVKCLPYSILTAMMILVFLFEKSIFSFIKSAFKKGKILARTESLECFKKNYKKIKYFSLPNYNMALNPQYKKLLKLNMVDYKSIQCFVQGSTLTNLILKKKTMQSKKVVLENSKSIEKIIEEDVEDFSESLPVDGEIEAQYDEEAVRDEEFMDNISAMSEEEEEDSERMAINEMEKFEQDLVDEEKKNLIVETENKEEEVIERISEVEEEVKPKEDEFIIIDVDKADNKEEIKEKARKEVIKEDIKQERREDVKEEPEDKIMEEIKAEEEASEVIKEEPKEEVNTLKEESKEVLKEESKKVLKEEPKDELKEEPKEELKEEPKEELKQETKQEEEFVIIEEDKQPDLPENPKNEQPEENNQTQQQNEEKNKE